MRKTLTGPLSIGTLLQTFWGRVSITWGLTILETVVFALLPLLIGRSIDGLMENDWTAFGEFVAVLFVLLVVGTGRRIFDTRAYGTIRVELGKAQVSRSQSDPVSVTNARILMGRELVDFLETEAPEAMTATIQVVVSVVILLTFHGLLAVSAGAAAIAIVLIFSLFARRFFRLNGALNAQTEKQVSALETGNLKDVAAHFVRLRRQEVRISDTESIAYGLIFLVLLTMLAFNLWFAATQSGATTGQIFSIVAYSYEFVQAAVTLPIVLQSLTRLTEITERINRTR